ncbi:hypothetical protein ACJZ2D_008591 [Fusarium nematophilum]
MTGQPRDSKDAVQVLRSSLGKLGKPDLSSTNSDLLPWSTMCVTARRVAKCKLKKSPPAQHLYAARPSVKADSRRRNHSVSRAHTLIEESFGWPSARLDQNVCDLPHTSQIQPTATTTRAKRKRRSGTVASFRGTDWQGENIRRRLLDSVGPGTVVKLMRQALYLRDQGRRGRWGWPGPGGAPTKRVPLWVDSDCHKCILRGPTYPISMSDLDAVRLSPTAGQHPGRSTKQTGDK